MPGRQKSAKARAKDHEDSPGRKQPGASHATLRRRMKEHERQAKGRKLAAASTSQAKNNMERGKSGARYVFCTLLNFLIYIYIYIYFSQISEYF